MSVDNLVNMATDIPDLGLPGRVGAENTDSDSAYVTASQFSPDSGVGTDSTSPASTGSSSGEEDRPGTPLLEERVEVEESRTTLDRLTYEETLTKPSLAGHDNPKVGEDAAGGEHVTRETSESGAESSRVTSRSERRAEGAARAHSSSITCLDSGDKHFQGNLVRRGVGKNGAVTEGVKMAEDERKEVYGERDYSERCDGRGESVLTSSRRDGTESVHTVEEIGVRHPAAGRGGDPVEYYGQSIADRRGSDARHDEKHVMSGDRHIHSVLDSEERSAERGLSQCRAEEGGNTARFTEEHLSERTDEGSVSGGITVETDDGRVYDRKTVGNVAAARRTLRTANTVVGPGGAHLATAESVNEENMEEARDVNETLSEITGDGVEVRKNTGTVERSSAGSSDSLTESCETGPDGSTHNHRSARDSFTESQSSCTASHEQVNTSGARAGGVGMREPGLTSGHRSSSLMSQVTESHRSSNAQKFEEMCTSFTDECGEEGSASDSVSFTAVHKQPFSEMASATTVSPDSAEMNESPEAPGGDAGLRSSVDTVLTGTPVSDVIQIVFDTTARHSPQGESSNGACVHGSSIRTNSNDPPSIALAAGPDRLVDTCSSPAKKVTSILKKRPASGPGGGGSLLKAMRFTKAGDIRPEKSAQPPARHVHFPENKPVLFEYISEADAELLNFPPGPAPICEMEDLDEFAGQAAVSVDSSTDTDSSDDNGGEYVVSEPTYLRPGQLLDTYEGEKELSGQAQSGQLSSYGNRIEKSSGDIACWPSPACVGEEWEPLAPLAPCQESTTQSDGDGCYEKDDEGAKGGRTSAADDTVMRCVTDENLDQCARPELYVGAEIYADTAGVESLYSITLNRDYPPLMPAGGGDKSEADDDELSLSTVIYPNGAYPAGHTGQPKFDSCEQQGINVAMATGDGASSEPAGLGSVGSEHARPRPPEPAKFMSTGRYCIPSSGEGERPGEDLISASAPRGSLDREAREPVEAGGQSKVDAARPAHTHRSASREGELFVGAGDRERSSTEHHSKVRPADKQLGIIKQQAASCDSRSACSQTSDSGVGTAAGTGEAASWNVSAVITDGSPTPTTTDTQIINNTSPTIGGGGHTCVRAFIFEEGGDHEQSLPGELAIDCRDGVTSSAELGATDISSVGVFKEAAAAERRVNDCKTGATSSDHSAPDLCVGANERSAHVEKSSASERPQAGTRGNGAQANRLGISEQNLNTAIDRNQVSGIELDGCKMEEEDRLQTTEDESDLEALVAANYVTESDWTESEAEGVLDHDVARVPQAVTETNRVDAAASASPGDATPDAGTQSPASPMGEILDSGLVMVYDETPFEESGRHDLMEFEDDPGGVDETLPHPAEGGGQEGPDNVNITTEDALMEATPSPEAGETDIAVTHRASPAASPQTTEGAPQQTPDFADINFDTAANTEEGSATPEPPQDAMDVSYEAVDPVVADLIVLDERGVVRDEAEPSTDHTHPHQPIQQQPAGGWPAPQSPTLDTPAPDSEPGSDDTGGVISEPADPQPQRAACTSADLAPLQLDDQAAAPPARLLDAAEPEGNEEEATASLPPPGEAPPQQQQRGEEEEKAASVTRGDKAQMEAQPQQAAAGAGSGEAAEAGLTAAAQPDNESPVEVTESGFVIVEDQQPPAPSALEPVKEIHVQISTADQSKSTDPAGSQAVIEYTDDEMEDGYIMVEDADLSSGIFDADLPPPRHPAVAAAVLQDAAIQPSESETDLEVAEILAHGKVFERKTSDSPLTPDPNLPADNVHVGQSPAVLMDTSLPPPDGDTISEQTTIEPVTAPLEQTLPDPATTAGVTDADELSILPPAPDFTDEPDDSLPAPPPEFENVQSVSQLEAGTGEGVATAPDSPPNDIGYGQEIKEELFDLPCAAGMPEELEASLLAQQGQSVQEPEPVEANKDPAIPVADIPDISTCEPQPICEHTEAVGAEPADGSEIAADAPVIIREVVGDGSEGAPLPVQHHEPPPAAGPPQPAGGGDLPEMFAASISDDLINLDEAGADDNASARANVQPATHAAAVGEIAEARGVPNDGQAEITSDITADNRCDKAASSTDPAIPNSSAGDNGERDKLQIVGGTLDDLDKQTDKHTGVLALSGAAPQGDSAAGQPESSAVCEVSSTGSQQTTTRRADESQQLEEPTAWSSNDTEQITGQEAVSRDEETLEGGVKTGASQHDILQADETVDRTAHDTTSEAADAVGEELGAAEGQEFVLIELPAPEEESAPISSGDGGRDKQADDGESAPGTAVSERPTGTHKEDEPPGPPPPGDTVNQAAESGPPSGERAAESLLPAAHVPTPVCGSSESSAETSPPPLRQTAAESDGANAEIVTLAPRSSAPVTPRAAEQTGDVSEDTERVTPPSGGALAAEEQPQSVVDAPEGVQVQPQPAMDTPQVREERPGYSGSSDEFMDEERWVGQVEQSIAPIADMDAEFAGDFDDSLSVNRRVSPVREESPDRGSSVQRALSADRVSGLVPPEPLIIVTDDGGISQPPNLGVDDDTIKPETAESESNLSRESPEQQIPMPGQQLPTTGDSEPIGKQQPDVVEQPENTDADSRGGMADTERVSTPEKQQQQQQPAARDSSEITPASDTGECQENVVRCEGSQEDVGARGTATAAAGAEKDYKLTTVEDAFKAVRKLKETSEQREPRPHSYHSEEHKIKKRYYNWNTQHFYPDIVDSDIGIVFSRSRDSSPYSAQYVEEDWIRDLQSYQQMEEMQSADSNKADAGDGTEEAMDTTMENIENVPPGAHTEHVEQKRHLTGKKSTEVKSKRSRRDDTRLDLDYIDGASSSSSGGEAAPNHWHKSPLHVRRRKRGDERSLSAEIPYKQPEEGKPQSPAARRRDEPRSRRSPRRLSAPGAAKSPAPSPRKSSDSGGRSPRRNSDLIQEKLQKFEELQKRRKALESTSEESLTSIQKRTEQYYKRKELLREKFIAEQSFLMNNSGGGAGSGAPTIHDSFRRSRTRGEVHYLPIRQISRSQEDVRYEGYDPQGTLSPPAPSPKKDRGGGGKPPRRPSDPTHHTPSHRQKKAKSQQHQQQHDLHGLAASQSQTIPEGNVTTSTFSETRTSEHYRMISSSFENLYDDMDLSMYSPSMHDIDFSKYRQLALEGKLDDPEYKEWVIDVEALMREQYALHRRQEAQRSRQTQTTGAGDPASGPSQSQQYVFDPVAMARGADNQNERIKHDVLTSQSQSSNWYVPQPDSDYESKPHKALTLDAKSIVEEEKKKFVDYKIEYHRRLSENASSSGMSGDERKEGGLDEASLLQRPVIPPDDYEYILRKIHHQRQDAYYDDATGDGASDSSSLGESPEKTGPPRSPLSPNTCQHIRADSMMQANSAEEQLVLSVSELSRMFEDKRAPPPKVISAPGPDLIKPPARKTSDSDGSPRGPHQQRPLQHTSPRDMQNTRISMASGSDVLSEERKIATKTTTKMTTRHISRKEKDLMRRSMPEFPHPSAHGYEAPSERRRLTGDLPAHLLRARISELNMPLPDRSGTVDGTEDSPEGDDDGKPLHQQLDETKEEANRAAWEYWRQQNEDLLQQEEAEEMTEEQEPEPAAPTPREQPRSQEEKYGFSVTLQGTMERRKKKASSSLEQIPESYKPKHETPQQVAAVESTLLEQHQPLPKQQLDQAKEKPSKKFPTHRRQPSWDGHEFRKLELMQTKEQEDLNQESLDRSFQLQYFEKRHPDQFDKAPIQTALVPPTRDDRPQWKGKDAKATEKAPVRRPVEKAPPPPQPQPEPLKPQQFDRREEEAPGRRPHDKHPDPYTGRESHRVQPSYEMAQARPRKPEGNARRSSSQSDLSRESRPQQYDQSVEQMYRQSREQYHHSQWNGHDAAREPYPERQQPAPQRPQEVPPEHRRTTEDTTSHMSQFQRRIEEINRSYQQPHQYPDAHPYSYPRHPATGGMHPQDPRHPASGAMHPQDPRHSAPGIMHPQDPRHPASGAMHPQDPRHPASGAMHPQDPRHGAYPRPGPEPRVKEVDRRSLEEPHLVDERRSDDDVRKAEDVHRPRKPFPLAPFEQRRSLPNLTKPDQMQHMPAGPNIPEYQFTVQLPTEQRAPQGAVPTRGPGPQQHRPPHGRQPHPDQSYYQNVAEMKKQSPRGHEKPGQRHPQEWFNNSYEPSSPGGSQSPREPQYASHDPRHAPKDQYRVHHEHPDQTRLMKWPAGQGKYEGPGHTKPVPGQERTQPQRHSSPEDRLSPMSHRVREDRGPNRDGRYQPYPTPSPRFDRGQHDRLPEQQQPQPQQPGWPQQPPGPAPGPHHPRYTSHVEIPRREDLFWARRRPLPQNLMQTSGESIYEQRENFRNATYHGPLYANQDQYGRIAPDQYDKQHRSGDPRYQIPRYDESRGPEQQARRDPEGRHKSPAPQKPPRTESQVYRPEPQMHRSEPQMHRAEPQMQRAEPQMHRSEPPKQPEQAHPSPREGYPQSSQPPVPPAHHSRPRSHHEGFPDTGQTYAETTQRYPRIYADPNQRPRILRIPEHKVNQQTQQSRQPPLQRKVYSSSHEHIPQRPVSHDYPAPMSPPARGDRPRVVTARSEPTTPTRTEPGKLKVSALDIRSVTAPAESKRPRDEMDFTSLLQKVKDYRDATQITSFKTELNTALKKNKAGLYKDYEEKVQAKVQSHKESRATDRYEEHVQKSLEKYRASSSAVHDGQRPAEHLERMYFSETNHYVDPEIIRLRKSNLQPDASYRTSWHADSGGASPRDGQPALEVGVGERKKEWDRMSSASEGLPIRAAASKTASVHVRLQKPVGLADRRTRSTENIHAARAQEDDINVKIGSIKERLFGAGGDRPGAPSFKQELENVWGREARRVSSLKGSFSEKDVPLPPYTSYAYGKNLDEDKDEWLFDFVSYKDGQSRRKSNLNDPLTDLEKTYENLDLENEDLPDAAARREHTVSVVSAGEMLPNSAYRREDTTNVKRLSITNVKRLEEIQQQVENPSLEYAKRWLSEKGRSVDEDVFLPPAQHSPNSAEVAQYTHPKAPSEGGNMSAISSEFRHGGRSSVPRKVSDDMAFRKHCKSTSSLPRGDGMSTSGVSYLSRSRDVTPAPSVASLNRNTAAAPRSGSPDPVRDDLSQRRGRSPSAGEPDPAVLAYPSPTSADYLAPRTSDPARGRLRMKPLREADRYHDDAAYRKLRKDVKPVSADIPAALYQKYHSRKEAGSLRTRSSSLDRLPTPQAAREQAEATLKRSHSLGPAAEPAVIKERKKENIAKGVAKMVDLFQLPVTHTQSAPDLREEEGPFCDALTFNSQGDLISDDPKYKFAVKPKKKETPRSIKQRHELRSKIKQMKTSADSGLWVESESDSYSSSGPEMRTQSPPDGVFDSDDHDLRVSDTSSDKETRRVVRSKPPTSSTGQTMSTSFTDATPTSAAKNAKSMPELKSEIAAARKRFLSAPGPDRTHTPPPGSTDFERWRGSAAPRKPDRSELRLNLSTPNLRDASGLGDLTGEPTRRPVQVQVVKPAVGGITKSSLLPGDSPRSMTSSASTESSPRTGPSPKSSPPDSKQVISVTRSPEATVKTTKTYDKQRNISQITTDTVSREPHKFSSEQTFGVVQKIPGGFAAKAQSKKIENEEPRPGEKRVSITKQAVRTERLQSERTLAAIPPLRSALSPRERELEVRGLSHRGLFSPPGRPPILSPDLSDGEMTDATDITLSGLLEANMARQSSPETLGDFSDYENSNLSDTERVSSSFTRRHETSSSSYQQQNVRPSGALGNVSTAIQERTFHSQTKTVTVSKTPGGGRGGRLGEDPDPDKSISFKDLVKNFEAQGSPFMKPRPSKES